MKDHPLLEALERRALVLDGAVGTLVLEAQGIRPEFGASAELACADHPELVTRVHEDYLNAGCDAVETNSFCAQRSLLGEAGERARLLNVAAARLARAACDRFTTPDRKRFALGAMGPGAHNVDLEDYATDCHEQAGGLLEGGVDALLIETGCSIDGIEACLSAVERAFETKTCKRPVFVSVTIAKNGCLPSGESLHALCERIDPRRVQLLALNCSSGPEHMRGPLCELRQYWSGFLGAYPNAGLPSTVDGVLRWPTGADEMAAALVAWTHSLDLRLVGGCCGTTPAHMRTLADALSRRS